jgi:hypothetical protein
MSEARELSERLEMLLVLQWLDEGASEDGDIAFSAATAAAELDLDDGKDGLLELMAALTELEERGVVSVAWPRGPGRDAQVTLAEDLRRDAARQFGRDPGSFGG